MGLKKKWIVSAEYERNRYVQWIAKIIKPMLLNNFEISFTDNEFDEDLPELLARMLNCEMLLDEDKEIRQFGADDTLPIKLKINKDKSIELWGKIYWLATPSNHKTYRNQLKDPFYCKMIFIKDELHIKQMLFGDFEANDIEVNSWVANEINWIYEFEF